jgi:serine/threonine protein kinase
MVSREEALLDLLERWHDGRQRGEPVSVEQLCADCPDLAGALRRHVALARRLDQLSGDEDAAPETSVSTTSVPSTLGPTGSMSSPAPLGRDVPVVPGYEDLQWLGGGGMGTVYRARDVQLDREVALKLVRVERLTAEMRTRLLVEARAVARLDHPHIVKVYAVGECSLPEGGEPVPYVALEYVPGGSLHKRLGGQALPPAEAARLVMLLARAVQHAHERGIVHRDLKPDNVLLSAACGLAEPHSGIALGDNADPAKPQAAAVVPKITDFGLARHLESDQRLTGTGAVLGTPAYMAPEQAEGHKAGPPADVWALGVILYRLLAGRLPFEAPSVVDLLHKVCHDEPAPLRERCPQAPVELERICRDCLAKEPAVRPTAGELAERLEAVGQGRGGSTTASWSGAQAPAPPVTAAPGRSTPRRVAIKLWGCGIAVSVAVIMCVLVLVAGQSIRSWVGSGRDRSVDTGVSPKDTPPTVADPLVIRRLEVKHFAVDGKDAQLRGLLGEKSFETRFGDQLQLTVVLSESAYFYVIGFAANGKENLLWPADKNNEAQPNRAPPRLDRLRFPRGDDRLTLDDSPKGGLEVYAVAASRQPLPPYAEWRPERHVTWRALPAVSGVWQVDATEDDEPLVWQSTERGSVKKAVGAPPLGRLCRSLRGGGVEVVEVIAFPVLAREK